VSAGTGANGMTGNGVAASSPAGSIYDLGYRHYEGKRHGRWYATWSLFVESSRGIWGFGRPTTAKAAPFILTGLYAFLAFIQLAFSSVFSQEMSQGNSVDLFTYANYFERMGFFVVFFCVAQAPEVVCRDQRYQVLPLYFTRALGRWEYALARLASLVTALFIVLMVPLAALFIGDVLMKPDTFKAIGDEVPRALPAIPANLLISLSMASISLALSAFSPRRAYSAIGLLAYFLLMEAVPGAIYGIGHSVGSTWVDYLILLTPTTALGAANSWFFGRIPTEGTYPASLGTDAYVLGALVSIVFFTTILLLRYRRIAA
jgi:ABC-2 type transport system permease protein